MSLESALIAYLSAQSGVTAVFGSSPLRIFPLVLPQSATLPAARYQRIDTTRGYTAGGDEVLPEARMQIAIEAATYEGARTAADAVQAALSGYRGTFGGIYAGRVLLAADRVGRDVTTGRATVTQDYLITQE